MNVYLYRYGSICEPDILDSFQRLGLTVIEEKTEITNKNISNSRRVQLVEHGIREHRPLFVFSINFYPAIAEICQIYQTPYFCWTVDSPVPELFSESIRRTTNRIFLFDRAQYLKFAPYNPSHIFHLPLASATDRFDKVIAAITDQDRRQYAKDIAFVGSLYNEKSPLTDLRRADSVASAPDLSTHGLSLQRSSSAGLSDRTLGYLDALEESALKIYGYNFIENALESPFETIEIHSKADSVTSTNETINVDRQMTTAEKTICEIKEKAPFFYDPGKSVAPSDPYVAAHSFIGMEVAMKERLLTLQTLAKHFPVDLYTKSDASELLPNCNLANKGLTPPSKEASHNLRIHGGVASLTEMPKIFHLSKINLNMTIKPIQEGLPLRIFDILGCGGFCMTNYQPELPDLFEIGRDLEAYASLDELADKCAYYLEHEDERKQIALNGYRKVCENHTYLHRMKAMIQKATE